MRDTFAFAFATVLVHFTISASVRDTTRDECESRCNDVVLMNYLATLQVLTPESIVNLAVDDLDMLCSKLDDSTQQIRRFLKTCKPPPPGDLYMSLINGLRVLNLKMCSADSAFLKRYVLYFPCVHKLKEDYLGCTGPADWTEELDEKKLCISYKYIVDCYYVDTAKVCGLDAASTVKELVMDIIDNVICVKCRIVRRDPYVKDPMPKQYMQKKELEAKGDKLHVWPYVVAVLSLVLMIGILK